MAEALIMARDNVNNSLSPEDQIKALHKKGDIIVVKPDGWQWGGAERDVRKFIIVNVPDSYLNNGYEAAMDEQIHERQSIAMRRVKRLSRMASEVQRRESLMRHRYAIDTLNQNQLVDKRRA